MALCLEEIVDLSGKSNCNPHDFLIGSIRNQMEIETEAIRKPEHKHDVKIRARINSEDFGYAKQISKTAG